MARKAATARAALSYFGVGGALALYTLVRSQSQTASRSAHASSASPACRLRARAAAPQRQSPGLQPRAASERRSAPQPCPAHPGALALYTLDEHFDLRRWRVARHTVSAPSLAPMRKTRPIWPASAAHGMIGRGWPKFGAALSMIWR